MQNLPTAETYHEEFKYMPWGILISEIIKYVVSNVPQNGAVLDLLCGTGYLLGEIQKQRPDIQFVGVDLEKEFINYAKKEYPKINFETSDVLVWDSKQKFDAVLCTGGLHHLPFTHQRNFIHKIKKLVKDTGFAIIADPYIDNYTNERERQLAAIKLGYEYLVATIKNDATLPVMRATLSLIENDLFLVESKNSIQNVEPYFKEYFSNIEKHKTWPKQESEYGEYYFIVRN